MDMAPPNTISAGPARSVEWTLTDPLLSHDSNSSTWLSLTDTVGKLDDYLGIDHKLDKYPLYRAASLLYSAATVGLFGHLSHEMGHQQPRQNLGLHGKFEFAENTTGFFFPYKPVLSYQKNENNIVHDRSLHILQVAAGLNQQTFNLQQLSARVVRNDAMPPDLALSYFLNAFFPATYTLVAGNSPTCNGHCSYDPIQYRRHLNYQDLSVLSYKTYIGWQLGALALNGRVTDSVTSLLHYLHTGKRDATPLSLSAGRTRFYLPETNLLHHPSGLLLTVDEPIRGLLQANDGVTVHFGAGVAGLLNAVRFGLEYDGLKVFPHRLAPEVTAGYTNTTWHNGDKPTDADKLINTALFKRSFGHSAKIALAWHLPGGVDIEIGNRFSYRDPIESDIKLRNAMPLKPVENSADQTALWWYSRASYRY